MLITNAHACRQFPILPAQGSFRWGFGKHLLDMRWSKWHPSAFSVAWHRNKNLGLLGNPKSDEVSEYVWYLLSPALSRPPAEVARFFVPFSMSLSVPLLVKELFEYDVMFRVEVARLCPQNEEDKSFGSRLRGVEDPNANTRLLRSLRFFVSNLK